MHIEPGVVDGAKIILGAVTGVASVGMVAKLAIDQVKQEGSFLALVGRSVVASAMVLGFFEFLPHPPVGVSEVHLILGTTLFLILGAVPTAIGLIVGLTFQSLLFAPSDIPQLGLNLTTLVVPVLAMAAVARRIIPSDTPYTDVTYAQAAKLSVVFQGGVVSWVAFWVFYGQGFTAETLANAGAFASVYIIVVLLEPLIDLGALALAKTFTRFERTGLPHARLYQPA